MTASTRTIDVKDLLRQAIDIIEAEREIAFYSYVDSATGKIPGVEERAEVRKYDRWLKRAKAAIA